MPAEIENIILSGGGHNIITMFGAITYLKKVNYIDFSKIKTIDGTSAGALLGFILMLNVDDEDIVTYLVERPWEKVFDITPEIIFQTFQSKGIFDIKIIEKILDPIMKSSEIERNITFKELYQTNGIDFNVYVSELNNLEMVRLSHETTPDEKIISAIYKSCAIPPLFKPVIENSRCYFDGGVFANYPLHCFLSRMDEIDEDKIFGIKLIYEKSEDDAILTDSNMTEYVFAIVKKLIQNVVVHREHNINIPNELLIYSKGMSFETVKKSILSADERKFLINEGKRYASVYYEYKVKQLTTAKQYEETAEVSQIQA